MIRDTPGDKITINEKKFTVVGILEKIGSKMDDILQVSSDEIKKRVRRDTN